MNHTMRLSIVAALASAVALGTAAAQSSQNGQNGQNQQTQPKPSQTQDNSGVSSPPPDSTIQADEMPVPPAPAPKPSAAIPATTTSQSSAPAGAQTNAAPAPAQTVQTTPATQPVDPGDDIVSGPAQATANTNTNMGSGQDDNNPDDFGIVTSVPPAPPAATTPDGWNPNNAIVTSVPVDPNALAEGTNITVRLKQDLSTSSTQAGATFSADVTQNVYNGSQLIIPAGSEMRGRVVHVSQGHHLVSRATIMLRPDRIVLPDGTAYHLYAVAVESQAPGTGVNDEGGIVAGHHYKKDAVEYGAGAGVGAAAGGAFGGPVGAGAGAVVGTGLVGTHMLLQAPSAADLPQGSVLIFSLTEPMPLTPTKN